MPARIVQRVDQVPADEFRPFCIECTWVGDATDEAGCAQAAYAHNRDLHDGAGVDAQLSDFLPDSITNDLAHYRRLFWYGVVAAVVCSVAAMIQLGFGQRGGFQQAMGGVQIFAAVVNAFSAGKWARRIEAAELDMLRLNLTVDGGDGQAYGPD